MLESRGRPASRRRWRVAVERSSSEVSRGEGFPSGDHPPGMGGDLCRWNPSACFDPPPERDASLRWGENRRRWRACRWAGPGGRGRRQGGPLAMQAGRGGRERTARPVCGAGDSQPEFAEGDSSGEIRASSRRAEFGCCGGLRSRVHGRGRLWPRASGNPSIWDPEHLGPEHHVGRQRMVHSPGLAVGLRRAAEAGGGGVHAGDEECPSSRYPDESISGGGTAPFGRAPQGAHLGRSRAGRGGRSLGLDAAHLTGPVTPGDRKAGRALAGG